MKKIYKLGWPLGATISIVAPLATVVACGSNGKGGPSILPGPANSSVSSIESKSVSLTEYDIERNILNTEKNGILPLSRILHTFEARDFGNALTKIDSQKTSGIIEKETIKKTDIKNPQLIEHAKIFIDSSVQVNGKAQSLDNPLTSFSISKLDIIKNTDAYQQLSDQIQSYISNHSTNGEKYSVLTLSTKDDVKDAKDEFSTGEYQVNIYQKASNSDTLKKAIELFKSQNFGSDEDALKKLGGFTFTPIDIEKNSDPNKSIYSNYIQEEQDNGTSNIADNKDLYTNKSVPRVFDKNALIDQSVIGDTSFTSTEAVNGSSSFQFASKNLTNADMDFLDENVSEVANLAINKKTNQIMLEMTVTTVNDAKLTSYANGAFNSDEKALNANYETGSVETIYIDLPKHTSWITDGAQTIMKELFDNFQKKVNLPSVYDSFKQLFAKAQDKIAGYEPLTIQGLIGPHLKNILIDDAQWFTEAAKYVDILRDENIFAEFINWAEKHNSAFSAATLNQIIKNFTEVPTALGPVLNSSNLYTFFGYVQIFYREVSRFIASPEGVKHKDKLSATTAEEQLEKVLVKAFTDEVKLLKNKFDGKSFDSNKKLPSYNAAINKIIDLPQTPQNLRVEITNIIFDKSNNSAKVEITFSPVKSKTAEPKKVNATITNLPSDNEINTIMNNLKTKIPSITGSYKIADQILIDSFGEMVVTNSTLDKTTFKFRNDGYTLDYPLPNLVNDVQLTEEFLNAIIGQTEFDKLDLETKAPTGTKLMFKAQNVNLVSGTFELLVGLRDVATNVTTYGSNVIKISK